MEEAWATEPILDHCDVDLINGNPGWINLLLEVDYRIRAPESFRSILCDQYFADSDVWHKYERHACPVIQSLVVDDK